MRVNLQIWRTASSVLGWLQIHPLVLSLLGLASGLFEPRRYRQVVATILIGASAVLFFVPFESQTPVKWAIKALVLGSVFIYAFWSLLIRISKSGGGPFKSRPQPTEQSDPLNVVDHAIAKASSLHAEIRTESYQMSITMAPPPLPPSGTREAVNRLGPEPTESAFDSDSSVDAREAGMSAEKPAETGDNHADP